MMGLAFALAPVLVSAAEIASLSVEPDEEFGAAGRSPLQRFRIGEGARRLTDARFGYPCFACRSAQEGD